MATQHIIFNGLLHLLLIELSVDLLGRLNHSSITSDNIVKVFMEHNGNKLVMGNYDPILPKEHAISVIIGSLPWCKRLVLLYDRAKILICYNFLFQRFQPF